MMKFLKMWPFFAYLAPLMRPRGWYGHKFHICIPLILDMLQIKNGNNLLCNFQEEDKM